MTKEGLAEVSGLIHDEIERRQQRIERLVSVMNEHLGGGYVFDTEGAIYYGIYQPTAHSIGCDAESVIPLVDALAMLGAKLKMERIENQLKQKKIESAENLIVELSEPKDA